MTWALPLLVLALLGGSYPLRRQVLQEAWGFAAYASHILRFAAGSAGFFVLLAATPALVVALGPTSAMPLLLLLVLWAAASGPVFLFLVRARPLDRPDLAPHLDRIVAASGGAGPKVHHAGPRGGRMMNAFALPGLPRPSVLLTDDLLDLFSPAEVAAVFAHEVAHLEHYSRRRTWLRALALLLLAALAVFAAPYAASRAPGVSGWITTGWALVVLLAVPAGMAAHRGHEAESDRRAVQLCGDAEALVCALTKLHTLAILPRRWSLEVERGSSHPSLARRIQAIRQAAGTVPTALPAPVVLAGEDAGYFVVLDAERAHWLEGAPVDHVSGPDALRLAATAVRSFAYGDLSDLHLDAGPDKVVLHARSVAGRKWGIRLRRDSVAAAQAALDVVDTRLAPTATSAAPPQALGALTAALLAIAGVLAGHPLLVLPPAAVGLWRPGPGPLAAAGATALAAALWTDLRTLGTAGVQPLTAATLGLAGVVGLVAALVLWQRAPAARGRGAGAILAVQIVVVTGALLGVAAAATFGSPLLRVHQAAAGPAAPASLLGLGAALLFRERRGGRWAALLPLGTALLVVFAGSDAFARRFVSDPLLAAPPALRQEALRLVPLAEYRFRGPAAELRLSPSGRTFAVRGWGEDDEGPSRFRTGGDGVVPREIEALDLRFVDDERVVLVADRPEVRIEVRLLRLAAEEPEWSVDLGKIVGPQLEVSPDRGLWRVTGADLGAGEARVFSGALLGEPPTMTAFGLPKGPPGVLVLGARGGLSLRPDLRHLSGGSTLLPLLTLAPRGTGALFDTELVLLTPAGPRPLGLTALEPLCVPPDLDGPIFCLAHDGSRTTVWEIDPESGRREPRGTVPGRLAAWQAIGERLLATSASLGPVLLHPREGSYARLAWGPGYAGAAGASTLGLLRGEAGGGTVAVYAAR